MNNNFEVTRELPKYQSHKKVWALKIKEFNKQEFLKDPKTGNKLKNIYTIVPENKQYSPFNVSQEYYDKHQPKQGGYYVVYDDGYKSFSPAEAFESGYTLIS